MSLSPPTTVGKLQTALHTKAKNSPDYRFYAAVRQVVSPRHPGVGPRQLPQNRGGTGGRRPELCGHRDVWPRDGGWRTDGVNRRDANYARPVPDVV